MSTMYRLGVEKGNKFFWLAIPISPEYMAEGYSQHSCSMRCVITSFVNMLIKYKVPPVLSITLPRGKILDTGTIRF